MTDPDAGRQCASGPWIEAGLRKVLLPARRTGTLALSPDGRLALATSHVASLILPRAIGLSVAAGDGEMKPDGILLRHRGLAHIHAMYPAVIGHELICQFPSRLNARLFTSSTTADYVPSSEDIQTLSWSPMSRGPALLVVDGAGDLHFMHQPASAVVSNRPNSAPGLFIPSSWNDITQSFTHNSRPFPKRATCGEFCALQSPSCVMEDHHDHEIVLLAIGSKFNVSIWHWPTDATFPVFGIDIRDGWTSCVAWMIPDRMRRLISDNGTAVFGYLACSVNDEVFVYKVSCEWTSNNGNTPSIVSSPLWKSGSLQGTNASCMSWWQGLYNDNPVVRLGYGLGNSIYLTEWVLDESSILSSPQVWPSSVGHQRILSNIGFLISGELISSSLDGSVLVWCLSRDSPEHESTKISAEDVGISLIENSQADSEYVRKHGAVHEQGSSRAGTAGRRCRNLAPRRNVRSVSFDQPVYSMIVSNLKLAIAVLFTVPATGDDHEDDVIDESAMRQKFRSSARLSRVALYVSEFHADHSIVGRKIVRERIISIVGLLLTAGEANFAFSSWDLELWLANMDLASKAVFVNELWEETQSLLETDAGSAFSESTRMRAARCLSDVVQRAADPSSQVEVVLGAERMSGSLTQAILVDFCGMCLTRALRLIPSQMPDASFAIMNYEEMRPSSIVTEVVFDKSETECLQAMCSFIFGFHEEVPLCNLSNAVKYAQDMLRYLAVFATSDGTIFCPVCASANEKAVLTCADGASKMTFSCAEGDRFPRCALTIRPCLSCAPSCCRGCGANVTPGIFNAEHDYGMNSGDSGRSRFGWLALQVHCPICLCRIEPNPVDPPKSVF
jgi:hypothetical protein